MHRALLLLVASQSLCVVTPQRLLASSDFMLGVEGWEARTESAVTFVSQIQLHKEREHDFMPVECSDGGEDLWYFQAPPKFLGDKSAAFGGYLEFILGWGEHSLGRYEPDDGRYDVILETPEGRVGRKGINPIDISYRGQHRVKLEASMGWEWATGAKKETLLTDEELKGVLSNLSGLLLLGGHYHGPEVVHLSSVNLVAPMGLGQSRLAVSRMSAFTVPVMDHNYKDGDQVVEDPVLFVNTVWNVPFPHAGKVYAMMNHHFELGEFSIIGLGGHGDSFCTISIQLQQFPYGEHYLAYTLKDRSTRKTGVELGLWIYRDEEEDENATATADDGGFGE